MSKVQSNLNYKIDVSNVYQVYFRIYLMMMQLQLH